MNTDSESMWNTASNSSPMISNTPSLHICCMIHSLTGMENGLTWKWCPRIRNGILTMCHGRTDDFGYMRWLPYSKLRNKAMSSSFTKIKWAMRRESVDAFAKQPAFRIVILVGLRD